MDNLVFLRPCLSNLVVCLLSCIRREKYFNKFSDNFSKLIDFYRYDVDSKVVNAAINAVIVKPRNSLKSFVRYQVVLFLLILLSNFWL